ncbi:hypothetical protein GQ600_4011 [Phytophthora cactorum]|nr:hypothetical protein GQ600_4011 [Phytophthora cactorum]
MQPNGNGSPSGRLRGFLAADAALASKIEAYLAGITVTDHNPAILFNWDNVALEEFVQAANAEADGHPQWFSQPEAVCDHVLLAPNSLIQYGHLQERLQYMQYDDFMQKCMANVTPGRTLARTFALTVRPSSVLCHSMPTAPPPVRQLFE